MKFLVPLAIIVSLLGVFLLVVLLFKDIPQVVDAELHIVRVGDVVRFEPFTEPVDRLTRLSVAVSPPIMEVVLYGRDQGHNYAFCKATKWGECNVTVSSDRGAKLYKIVVK